MLKSNSLYRLWQAIPWRRRAQLIALLGFTLVASAAEVFSIGAVLPFLGMLTSPESVYQHRLAQPFVQSLGLTSPQELLLPVTVLFCLSTLLASVTRILTIWLRTHLTYATGADLSVEIYGRTLFQPYAVHISRNSSEVIDGISVKVGTVIVGVLAPIIVILSNGLMLAVILLALLLYQPIVALISIGGFGLLYALIYLGARARLQANSREVAVSSTERIKSLQEGLGSIRDVLLDNTQAVYCEIYHRADRRQRRAQAQNSITGEVPRFFIETLGIVFIAILAFRLAQEAAGFAAALPTVGGLAIAAQRVLPLLQQIYYGATTLSGSEQSLEDTLNLLEQPMPEPASQCAQAPLPFSDLIECRSLSFRYRDDRPWVLSGLNLQIPKGSRIGLIGETGGGKSTLVDILMGLLEPVKGKLTVDGVPVTSSNALRWQRHIAHVPQAIYLSDTSVAENIAFGVPREQIKMDRVRQAAHQAQIATTIESWREGYATQVGERGVRLSGGQRQRIGIARALYKQADVLIFDEATSALDTQTEKAVMEAIEQLGRELTIIIVAHRLSTISGCDMVITIKSGGAIVTGAPPDEISQSTPQISKVAE